MCVSERCCFCIRLDLGCLLIGVFSLILSTAMAVVSILYLAAEGQDYMESHPVMRHLLGLAHLDVNHPSKQLIFGIILFLSVLWIISSMVLLLGIKLRVPGYLLSYFAAGIFITFFAFLSSLLFLLSGLWLPALILLGALLIHIHFLVVVYTFYELILHGKVIVSNTMDTDEEILIQP